MNGCIHRSTLIASLIFVCCTLIACATPPISTDTVTVQITPDDARANPASAKGTVIWGGVIVSAVNLADRTQFEVLDYPLDRHQRPDTTKPSRGRFLMQSPDYLETETFAAGRSITVLGSLQGVVQGSVGQAKYDYPTMTINDIHLWNPDDLAERPRFIFGIGLQLGG